MVMLLEKTVDSCVMVFCNLTFLCKCTGEVKIIEHLTSSVSFFSGTIIVFEEASIDHQRNNIHSCNCGDDAARVKLDCTTAAAAAAAKL